MFEGKTPPELMRACRALAQASGSPLSISYNSNSSLCILQLNPQPTIQSERIEWMIPAE